MLAQLSPPVDNVIHQSMREIQSSWSEEERSRRHRVAERRQRRLMRLISSRATPHVCDVTVDFCESTSDPAHGTERHTRKLVLLAQ